MDIFSTNRIPLKVIEGAGIRKLLCLYFYERDARMCQKIFKTLSKPLLDLYCKEEHEFRIPYEALIEAQDELLKKTNKQMLKNSPYASSILGQKLETLETCQENGVEIPIVFRTIVNFLFDTKAKDSGRFNDENLKDKINTNFIFKNWQFL
jgi:hypothetical protein